MKPFTLLRYLFEGQSTCFVYFVIRYHFRETTRNAELYTNLGMSTIPQYDNIGEISNSKVIKSMFNLKLCYTPAYS